MKNKCLTDELKQELEQTSVQAKESNAEPKFKVGDKVRIIRGNMHKGEVTEIVFVDKSDSIVPYKVDLYNEQGGGKWYQESDLEPYTEPTQTNDNMEEKEHRNLSNFIENSDKCEDNELNLKEILKGHEGETFFDMIMGDVVLDTISETITDHIVFHAADGQAVSYTDPWLSFHKSGTAVFYPSRESYLKYPLDAKRAWSEWVEEQKPKRWRAGEGETYWWICSGGSIDDDVEHFQKSDDECYAYGNYFRTKDLAKQAAEAVKECLMKFHEENQQ